MSRKTPDPFNDPLKSASVGSSAGLGGSSRKFIYAETTGPRSHVDHVVRQAKIRTVKIQDLVPTPAVTIKELRADSTSFGFGPGFAVLIRTGPIVMCNGKKFSTK
jgi:hypothetical protein